jgi:excisionase family DNA binding protein
MVTMNFSGRGSGNFLKVAEIWLESPAVIRYLMLSYFIMESKEAVTDMEPQDKWLTIEELSGYLKMSRSKLYQMAQKGELPGSKIGTQWRFDRNRIDEWMETRSNAATARNQKA